MARKTKNTEVIVDEQDITAFAGATVEAINEADTSTGDVPEANIATAREAYQALDGIKPKNAAKTHLAELLREALREMDAPKAKAIMQLTEQAAVAGKATPARKPVDPNEAFISQVAQLTLALYLAQRNPAEGVDVEASVEAATERATEAFEQANEAFNDDEIEVDSPLVRNAIRLARTRRGRGSYGGPRRDLGAHIAEAFDSVESGTFMSVADIRNFTSTVYGTDLPSAGAISNRLEPKGGAGTTVPGITVERRDGKLGAVKN